MAAQHAPAGDYSTRYKFNGKELDQATGLYYYGARYYDPKISTWLSVDPLAEKYQPYSPYNYTLNNPINLIDPDGRHVDKFDKKNNKVAKGQEKAIKKKMKTLNKQIKKLGCTEEAGILLLRVIELQFSLDDIKDMRKDLINSYVYASNTGKNKNVTKRTGAFEITMFSENIMAKKIHENRHGGQFARRLFDVSIDGRLLSGGYGEIVEVSAYSAQLAYDGFVSYFPKINNFVYDSNFVIEQIKNKVNYPTMNDYFTHLYEKKITSFSSITKSFLNSAYDTNLNGVKLEQTRVYHF